MIRDLMKQTACRTMIWIAAPLLALAACAHPAAPPPATADVAPAAKPAGPDKLVVSFAQGGATLTPQAEAQLDTAARTYRDGHPLMMYVAGYTDKQGTELANLMLAARRAEAVKAGLIARGIPADRLEATALGEANPVVPTAGDTPEPANRRVVITWK